ncbi:hypothetical protein K488DRAFT_69517 [Vararia minispora EC-137]|uniref:Uncharacterized protein n=1 Tax=Vararia minispora EC-137 TaxID=1314806 RepID=A0ACB8QQQ4_9AGAM|nr:hypothetical protein K488DRAFT_69517 [Vararia minispora EC-137]
MLSFVLAALALSSSALPTPLAARTTGCAGLPDGLSSDPSFTLQAILDTDQSAVTLGLVLQPGTSLFNLVIGVSDDATVFAMENSAIIAVPPRVGASAPVASSNAYLIFTSENPNPTAAPYCILANDPAGLSLPGPVLTVNGSADDFSLCTVEGEEVILYNAQGDATCRPVHIVVQQ